MANSIMNNHNKLLTRMAGTDGFKTGYYRETGFNLVATAQKNGLRFIVVVLGSPTAKVRDDIAIEKFKKAFGQYKLLNVVKRGEVIDKDVILDDGKYRKVKGVAGSNFQYPVPNDKKGQFKRKPPYLQALKEKSGKVKNSASLLLNSTTSRLGRLT